MRYFSALFLSLALMHGAVATDRVVSVSGLYPTVGEALLVSSDGDRILVEPGMYREDLAISKSVSILPNQQGSRPFLVGSINLLNADGKHVLISGMKCAGNFGKVGAYSTRTELDLVDSRIDGIITLIDPYIHLRMMRDTLACQVLLSSGTIVGNEILGCAGGAAGVLVQGASALPDDIRVIGNAFGAGVPGLGVSIASDARFQVENNYFRAADGYPAMTVQRTTSFYNGISHLLNNTFYRAVAGNSTAVSATNVSPFGAVARNNAVIGYSNGLGIGESHYSNVSTTFIAINTQTGGPAVGSPLINAGDPDPRYLDLDLTTNDAGCYGGSNSRANFTTAMGSAVVGFIQAPRVVAQGDAVNISATGFDR